MSKGIRHTCSFLFALGRVLEGGKSAGASSVGYRVAMEHTDAMLRHNPGCWVVLCRNLHLTQDRIRNIDWSRSTNEDEAFTKAPYERYDFGARSANDRERSMAASAAELSCVAYDPWPTINSTEHTTAENIHSLVPHSLFACTILGSHVQRDKSSML